MVGNVALPLGQQYRYPASLVLDRGCLNFMRIKLQFSIRSIAIAMFLVAVCNLVFLTRTSYELLIPRENVYHGILCYGDRLDVASIQDGDIKFIANNVFVDASTVSSEYNQLSLAVTPNQWVQLVWAEFSETLGFRMTGDYDLPKLVVPAG